MNGYSAIALKLEDSTWWVLSAPGCPEALNPDDATFPEIRPGVKAHAALPSGNQRLPIELMDQSGKLLIRLLETQRYEWEIICADEKEVDVSSTLETLPQRQWNKRRVKTLSGNFTVVNHLGLADFCIAVGNRRYRYALEVTSSKLHYETEFRQITEDIADFCQQLLLNWEGPTSLKFANDPNEAARLTLERFLFLRSHLPPQRVEELLEAIQRRPNSRLMRNTEWTPVSVASSSDWLRNPAAMARDWQRSGEHVLGLPGQVLDVRKEDTLDTPPNRFLKHALIEFSDICHEVLEKHPKALSLKQEAFELSASLDAVLARPMFRQIGPLTRLPLDNPTLQRRDGYREILRAWLLTQTASVLAWDRNEEAYHGPTRNVATLYEYWVFLQLHKILDEMEGVTRDQENPKPSDDAEPFLEVKDEELHINLKRGKKTCAPFTVDMGGGVKLRAHLYFERVYQWNRSATEAVSYSRQFKPDYTLSIFPASYITEQDAASEGKIAYIHFDAKYRAENLKMIFGDEEPDLDIEKIEGKSTATYKRGDLLKMHTYNDAVRQTAGSYVLYPGSDTERRLEKFHEILPGVGAFVLKPGIESCGDALKSFLRDVFRHQADQFTQYRHFSDVIHATVREEPKTYAEGKTSRPAATCVLIYAPANKASLFHSTGLAYCRAIRDDGTPVKIQIGNLSGAVICGYYGPHTGTRSSLDWAAPILSCEMQSRSSLSAILRSSGWPTSELPARASAYVLFRLGTPTQVLPRNVTALTPHGSYEAVSCNLRDLNECARS